MVRASRVAPCLFVIALMSTLIPTLLSVGFGAHHTSPIDQLFRDFERQPLDHQGRIALRALRNRFREESILHPQQPSWNSCRGSMQCFYAPLA